MKYPFLITTALTSLWLLTSGNTFAAETTAVPVEEQARWFEIEVILFKQVSKKSENPEEFIARDLSYQKGRAFDLLTPYLQPDIASLKALLPRCQQQEVILPYKLNITPHYLLPTVNEETSEKLTNSSLVTTSESGDSENDYQIQFTHVEVPVYNQYPSNKKTPLCVIPAEFFQKTLSPEQLAHFDIDAFPVEKLVSTVNGIEQWSDDESGEITWASEKPYLISQDSLQLKQIANRIKRNRNYKPLLHLGWRQIGENRRNAQAINLYSGENLVSSYQKALAKQDTEQQALEIEAILEQREQALITSQLTLAASDTAIDGTAQDSSLELARESSQVNRDIDGDELDRNELSVAELAVTELPIAEQLRLQAKQQQLDEIFAKYALFENNENSATDANVISEPLHSEEEVKNIVAQLSSDITALAEQPNVVSLTDKALAIAAPLQPWSVDGLFKVHLDHYLFINSEINIVEPVVTSVNSSVNKTPNSLKNASVKQTKLVSFKQDRRVISGEIHYFDHPHIGMIVQIRRFDPTKPADEAVSQSKK